MSETPEETLEQKLERNVIKGHAGGLAAPQMNQRSERA